MEEWSIRLGINIEHNNSLNIDEVFEKKGFVTASFENLINWNQPIIICEGVFDAMAIRRNAIPILGKNISKALLKKIVSSKVKEIYIALDKDALKKAVKFCEQFISMGKKVYLVDMEEKDPSEMGFQSFTNHIQDAEELDLSSLLQYKLNLL